MADSARLLVKPLINNPSYSSQNSSSLSTFNPGADHGLHKPGTPSCGAWLGPSQVAGQHISMAQSFTSSDSRSPALSHENSDTEDSPSLPTNKPGHKSVISSPQDIMDTSHKRLGSAGKYSRITKLRRRLKKPQSVRFLDKFRHRPHSRYGIPLPPPATANIFKLWKWEILNCFFTIGILGSMYGILRHYDDQRIPNWGTAINLSTLIALMATLLRTILVFVVAEIIGQAKWTYFAGDGGRTTGNQPMRRLIETSRFNDASQGLLGAVKLLPTIFRDPATLLAVTVMFVSLGTGSSVQQTIQTQSCQALLDSVNASIPISRNITAGRGGLMTTFGPLDYPNVGAALSSALAPENEEIGSPISVGCPTGNCTFQNSNGGVYSTLGICSLCTDTSSLITSTGWRLARVEKELFPDDSGGVELVRNLMLFEAKYTLSNGMSVGSRLSNITSPYFQTAELMVSASSQLGLDWAGDLISPEMQVVSQWAFANVTILTPDWLPTNSGYTDYVAATCTLYPCLRSYNAKVTSGKLDEVLVNTAPAVPDLAALLLPNITIEDIEELLSDDAMFEDNMDSYYADNASSHFRAVQSPCLTNDTVWTKENQSSNSDMQRLLLLHVDPNPSAARWVTIENITAPGECIYSVDAPAWFAFLGSKDKLFDGNCSATSNVYSPENTFQIDCGDKHWLSRFYTEEGTTAASIVKRIDAFTDRLSNKMRMGLLNRPETVSGQVLQATVCSRIHYVWLTFPAALVAITSALLAWAMFQSSRHRGREMVWKTSILPFLFYGDRFVVQNGEDVSGHSTESSRGDGAKEPLLDLHRMEAEARQQVVRFDVFN